MNKHLEIPLQEYIKQCIPYKKKWSENWAQFIQSRFSLKKARILEIGCGPGFLITKLSEILSGNDYFAMDTDYAALEWIIKLREMRPPIHCVQNEPYCFPFKNNLFDLIISEECLHSLNFIPFVTEIIRILKPGGKAVLIDINTRSLLFNFVKLKKLCFNFFKITSLTSFDKAFIHAVSKGYKKEDLQEHLKQIKNINYNIKTFFNWHYIEILKYS